MCGLAGLFFGTAKRNRSDLRQLGNLFTQLLAVSEARGTHATGVAILDGSGESRILKQPTKASRFILEPEYRQLLAELSPTTTLLMGHARWATRGDPSDNSNNHPLQFGEVVGTHNGTIWNADELFDEFAFERAAKVDSEVLVRIADCALREGAINDVELLAGLARCRGQMSAAFTSRLDPGRLLLFRGNNPLAARYHWRKKVLIYASEAFFLDAVLASASGWRELPLPEMHYLDVRVEDPGDAAAQAFEFHAEGPSGPPRSTNDSRTRLGTTLRRRTP